PQLCGRLLRYREFGISRCPPKFRRCDGGHVQCACVSEQKTCRRENLKKRGACGLAQMPRASLGPKRGTSKRIIFFLPVAELNEPTKQAFVFPWNKVAPVHWVFSDIARLVGVEKQARQSLVRIRILVRTKYPAIARKLPALFDR